MRNLRVKTIRVSDKGSCCRLAVDLSSHFRSKYTNLTNDVTKKKKKHSHLTDESTELTRAETVVYAGEDGNGDYNVAEDSSEVIKGVNADWERRGQQVMLQM